MKVREVAWAEQFVLIFIAHEIRNGKSARAKAVFALRAHFRWAVTGTPIQNRWEDLSSLLSFLRIYPDEDLRSLKAMLRADFANSPIKAMLTSICLRRPKSVIRLPSRTDKIHRLYLKANEADHYFSVRDHIVGFLDQEGDRANRWSYTNVLTKINALRQICNLTTLYRGRDEAVEGVSQDIFDGLLSAGIATCGSCARNLGTLDDDGAPNLEWKAESEILQAYMSQCGRLLCASCFSMNGVDCSDDGCSLRTPCTFQAVKIDNEPNKSPCDSSASFFPVKMRALQKDISLLPPSDKRYGPANTTY